MDKIQENLLSQIADIHSVPEGAYSLRINGQLHGKNSTENIQIVKKEDKPGIDIFIKAGTTNESVHIPVLLSQTGLKELVYNDFHIGEEADVVIVAGCGIHNAGADTSEHSGIHSFYLGKNARIKYVEKHYGEGDGNGKNIMNPTTHVELSEGAYMEMETAQIKGVDSTDRKTTAILGDSGIGKSTLLNVAAGLQKVSEGQATVECQKLAYIFQEPRLFPWLSALENVSTVSDRQTAKEMLSLMRPHAFFINTARAHMVDYDALYELLRDRKIMGAALEVHPVEPLPEDYPFLKLDNVTLTTHRGGDTINAYSDSPEMLVRDYARYLSGGKVRFFVNSEVGFGK